MIPEQPSQFDDVRGNVADNVLRLIEARRVSFGAAATACGLSKTGLYKIADGTSDPSLSSLCKIAAAFGVPLASLLDAALPAPSPEAGR